jgi:hypothetical protein
VTPEDITLEERVAALEALLLPRDPAWTDEQAAEFGTEFERHLSEGPFKLREYEVRPLPPVPVLTPETAMALAREYVTIVRPGEVLAVRLPMDFRGEAMDRVREFACRVGREAGVKVAFIPGEEFGVAQAAGGSVHVEVPVTATPGKVFTDPRYQRELQRAVQEVTVRHARLNPGGGKPADDADRD